MTWVPGNNFDLGATVGLISADVFKGQFIHTMENGPVTANKCVFSLQFDNGNLVVGMWHVYRCLKHSETICLFVCLFVFWLSVQD